MNETVFFTLKIFLSGLVIAGTSWLAGKKPFLSGFLIALPLMSLLTIAFSYWQYRDMEKINQYAVAIFSAVPLSLLFFVPFFLNRWLKMNFVMTMGSGLLLLAVAYGMHSLIFKAR